MIEKGVTKLQKRGTPEEISVRLETAEAVDLDDF